MDFADASSTDNSNSYFVLPIPLSSYLHPYGVRELSPCSAPVLHAIRCALIDYQRVVTIFLRV